MNTQRFKVLLVLLVEPLNPFIVELINNLNTDLFRPFQLLVLVLCHHTSLNKSTQSQAVTIVTDG